MKSNLKAVGNSKFFEVDLSDPTGSPKLISEEKFFVVVNQGKESTPEKKLVGRLSENAQPSETSEKTERLQKENLSTKEPLDVFFNIATKKENSNFILCLLDISDKLGSNFYGKIRTIDYLIKFEFGFNVISRLMIHACTFELGLIKNLPEPLALFKQKDLRTYLEILQFLSLIPTEEVYAFCLEERRFLEDATEGFRKEFTQFAKGANQDPEKFYEKHYEQFDRLVGILLKQEDIAVLMGTVTSLSEMKDDMQKVQMLIDLGQLDAAMRAAHKIIDNNQFKMAYTKVFIALVKADKIDKALSTLPTRLQKDQWDCFLSILCKNLTRTGFTASTLKLVEHVKSVEHKDQVLQQVVKKEGDAKNRPLAFKAAIRITCNFLRKECLYQIAISIKQIEEIVRAILFIPNLSDTNRDFHRQICASLRHGKVDIKSFEETKKTLISMTKDSKQKDLFYDIVAHRLSRSGECFLAMQFTKEIKDSELRKVTQISIALYFEDHIE